MKTRPIAAALGTAALLLGAVACGTTDVKDDADTQAAVSTAGDCADDKTTTATGPVSLTDAWGRKVELDKPAAKVAVLEWQQIEDVLSLCINPAAVSDVEGYTLWNTAEELPEGTTDLGVRGTPDIDSLVAAQPDLVIVEAYSADDEAIKQLTKYKLNVLATKGADAADPIKQMKDTFSLIAEATGRQERATAVLADFDAKLAEAKATVAEADLAVKKFTYFDGYIQGGNVALRPFGQGSLVGELGEALGLENAWTGKVDEAYGLGTTDIEGIKAVGDANLFYTGTLDPTGDYVKTLKENPIWAKLPAVTENRTFAFPSGVWTFGGPRSAERVLDAYVDSLTD